MGVPIAEHPNRGLPIHVVGIGADGWSGLPEATQAIVLAADVVFGSPRQCASVPIPAERRRHWPSPLLPTLRSSIDEFDGDAVCILASGDPMFHGIGVTLSRIFGASRLRIHPAPSSASLACARLGWAVHTTTTVNLVNTPVTALAPALSHGARVLVLSRDETTPTAVTGMLCERGFGPSQVTVLEQLGGEAERSLSARANDWTHPTGDPLNVVAIACVADHATTRVGRMPGLPDRIYHGDGQLTKSEVRVLTLAALAPSPGEHLWDVGGGSGSIAIEWMRFDPSCTATIFESASSRREQIQTNASALGVPGLRVLGAAPDRFDGTAAPDAIFIGGGLTQDGMVDACWDRLGRYGRLTANAVTAESEALLLECVSRFGGTLRKFQVYRGEPLGSFTAWRPQLPVAQWSAVKS